MTPLDDELRSALSSRTEQVAPSPDLFLGVERRARRLRRQRAAASVAGAALAASTLGVGGPMLASALSSSSPDRAPVASASPSASPAAEPYALDAGRPWSYRGDEQVRRELAPTAAREWAVRHGLPDEQVTFSPLFGQEHEPSATAELVYVATDATGAASWGVVRSSEAGPEFALDVPLTPGTTALVAALPGDEVARLLVVAAPGVTALEYGHDDASEWTALAELADGVGTTALDGDPATDRVRVVAGGDVVHDAPAPDSPAPPAADEGPGTDTPLEVDPAPYALDLADPWEYRGPAELAQHPELAVEDARLFGASGRGDGWSDRPLLAVESADGLSVLLVLHTRGDEAVVTTTSQRLDKAARQDQQDVRDGQLLVQSFLPQPDGSALLVALAGPRTGAVETDVRGAERLAGEASWGVWTVPPDAPAGQVLLYSEGDGLLFHAEPARRS